jgi:hypothetical protein
MRFSVKYRERPSVNVAIEIPDEIGRTPAGQAGDVSQQMPGLLLRRAEVCHDDTMEDLERDLPVIRDASAQ